MSDDLLPFELGQDKFFVPNCIVKTELKTLLAPTAESAKTYARELISQGWRFYVVDQSRGRCYGSYKVITIPLWATKRSADYLTWYVAHECAHAYDKCKHEHGPEFMEWLKKICPADCIHHELEYKPRNAAAAGIGQPKKLNYDDFF